MPVRFLSPSLGGYSGFVGAKHWEIGAAFRRLGADQWFVGSDGPNPPRLSANLYFSISIHWTLHSPMASRTASEPGRAETGAGYLSGAGPALCAERSGLSQADGSFPIEFENAAAAAAVFQVRSASQLHSPRAYTVEPGKSLPDAWPFASLGVANCDLSVSGPNGFFRELTRSISGLRGARLDVRAITTLSAMASRWLLRPAAQPADVTVLDQYTSESANVNIKAPASRSHFFSLAASRAGMIL